MPFYIVNTIVCLRGGVDIKDCDATIAHWEASGIDTQGLAWVKKYRMYYYDAILPIVMRYLETKDE